MSLLRWITILLAMLTAAPIVRADDEPLRVRAELSAQSLNVTQRATLTVHADVAQGWVLVDQPFDDLGAGDAFGPLLIAGAPRPAPARIVDGATSRSWTIELSPGLPETGQIPALRFKAQAIDGDRITIERTAPIPVTVESVLGAAAEGWDPTALRPALGPRPAPEQSNAALVVSLGVLAAVVAGGALLTLVGRRVNDPERAKLRLIRECRAEIRRLDAQAPVGVLAASACAIVRRALEINAGPSALAATGAELGPLLRGDAGLSPSDAAVVCDFFARADSAIYQPGASDSVDAEGLRDDAIRAVESVCHAAAGRAAR